MRKFPARAGAIVFPAIMAPVVTMIISGLTTLRARGFDACLLASGFRHGGCRAWSLSRS
jgi:hypothetical protein